MLTLLFWAACIYMLSGVATWLVHEFRLDSPGWFHILISTALLVLWAYLKRRKAKRGAENEDPD